MTSRARRPRRPTSSARSPSSATSPTMAAGLVPRHASAAPGCCARRRSTRTCPAGCGARARAGSPPSTRCCPGSSPERIRREVKDGKPSGRTQEIQRLIGRSLRAVCDMRALGERQVIVDCDVLQADGGTRTASICGGYVALHDALHPARAGRHASPTHPLTAFCAAISVGIVDGAPVLDLPYVEDARAEVDMNVVMTVAGRLRRGAGHRRGRALQPRASSTRCSAWPRRGIAEIIALQREMVARAARRRR